MADWAKVKSDAIAAAQGVLGSAWGACANGATAQINALVTVGQYVEANKASMTPDEYQSLLFQQKLALQNVLTGYVAIGIAAAQNAVAAVMNVILAALPGLVGL